MTEQVRLQAMKILERRDVSRKMLVDRLTEKGAAPEEAQEAADWLCSLGLLDDARYAGLVVRHYAGKGYGPRRIREELYRRGIPKPLWEPALEELPETADTAPAAAPVPAARRMRRPGGPAPGRRLSPTAGIFLGGDPHGRGTIPNRNRG